jgi:xanthine/uracil permease
MPGLSTAPLTHRLALHLTVGVRHFNPNVNKETTMWVWLFTQHGIVACTSGICLLVTELEFTEV